MTHQLRSALRDHTRASHARLDTMVGAFGDSGSYAAFLSASRVFRGGVETRLCEAASWQLAPLAELIDKDLDDLRIAAPPRRRFTMLPDGKPAALGAAYVAEGSALGARLLVGRAAKLGYHAGHGARHLAAQANDRLRWPAFLAKLEQVEAADHAQVLDGAEAAFAFAIDVYAGGAA